MDKEKLTILLIEDNPGDVRLLRKALAEAPGGPYRLLTTEWLAAGLKLLEEQPVDILLLDLGLPDSKGLAAVAMVNARFPTLPIVVLSGNQDEAVALDSLKFGAQDYLIKRTIHGAMLARVLKYAVERQRLKTALNACEARIHRIIDNNPDGMVVVDREGIIRYDNPAARELFGVATGSLLGCPLGSPTLDGASAEIDIVHHDGRDITAELRSVSSSWEGEPAEIVSLRDITNRKQIERDLAKARESAEAANRAKSDFMVTMSQEVRTPLIAVIGLCDLAQKTELSPPTRDYLAKIQITSQSLLKLVNNTLDYSWIEAGRLVLERIDFHLRELLDRITAPIGVRAQGKGLVLRVDIDQRVPDRLIGDPHRLEQVLCELLDNAITFTHEGGLS
jgi:signal transduction histidine kinase